MSKGPENGIKEIAGGWITERVGTPVPLFLKLVYAGFSVFGLAYLFLYRTGEVTHPTRGPAVAELNRAVDAPPAAYIAIVAALIVAFAGVLLAFAFRSEAGEEE
jgi:hypothetical protein